MHVQFIQIVFKPALHVMRIIRLIIQKIELFCEVRIFSAPIRDDLLQEVEAGIPGVYV